MRDELAVSGYATRSTSDEPVKPGGLVDNMMKLDEQLRGLGDTINELRRRLTPVLRVDESTAPDDSAKIKPLPSSQLIGHVQDMQGVVAFRHNELSAIIDTIDL